MPAAPSPPPAPVVARAPEPPPPAPRPFAAPEPAPAAPVNPRLGARGSLRRAAAPGPSKPAPEPPEAAPAPLAAAMFVPSRGCSRAGADVSAARAAQRSACFGRALRARSAATAGMHPMAMRLHRDGEPSSAESRRTCSSSSRRPRSRSCTSSETVVLHGSTAHRRRYRRRASRKRPHPRSSASPTAKVAAGPGGGHARSTGADAKARRPRRSRAWRHRLTRRASTTAASRGPPRGDRPADERRAVSSRRERFSGVVTSNQPRHPAQVLAAGARRAQSPNAPTNAKVNGTITIGPSGNVESANAIGGDAYPGLASCIAGRMRNWKFPQSGGSHDRRRARSSSPGSESRCACAVASTLSEAPR